VPSPLAPHALLERLSCQGPVLTALLHVLNALDWPRPALHASPITRSLLASARQTPVLRTRPSSAGAVKTAMPAASHARVPSPLAPHALLERLSCQGPVLTALLHVLNALDWPRPALHASPITRSLLASARQTPVLRTRPSSAGAVKTAMPAASHARVPSPLAPHALLERLSCQGPVLTALLHVLNALDWPRPALHASPITRSLLASARQTPVLRTRPSSAGAVKTAMPAASHARVPSPLAPHALLERLSCQGPVLTALLHVLNALDWPRPALHASPITRSLLASARQTPVLRTRPSSAGAVKTAMPAASHARVPSPLAPHALLERLSCQGPVLTALLHVLNALDWPRPALHASPITRSLLASARQTPVLRTRPSSAGAVKTAMPAASHARVPSPLAPHALLERLSCQGPVLTALLHVLNALDWPRPALHASPITRSLLASARQTPVLRTRPSSAGAVKTAMPAASHARVPSPLAPHALLERLSCQGPVLTALLHVLNALDRPRPALHASPITRSLLASARQTPVLRTRPSSAGAVKTAMPAASHARVPSPLAPHALLERLSCQGPVLTALLHVLNALDWPRPALHASPITRSLPASARQTPVLRTRPSSAGAVKTAMPAASHARVPSPLAPHALLERLSCQGPVLTALLHVLNALDWPRPALHASPITRSLPASARQTPVLRTRPSSAGAVKTAMPAASHARVPSPLAPHALLERLSCQGPVLTALLHVLNALDWPRPALHASPITRSLPASARQTPVLRTRPSSAGAVKTAMPAASHARVPSPLAPHALLERLSCQGPVLTALLHVLNALDRPRPALHASPITRSLLASARQTPVLRTRPSSAGAVKTAMPAASHARVPSPLAPHALLERLSCQGPVLTALLHVLNALDWPRPALHASPITRSLLASARQTPVLRTRPSSAGAVKTAMPAASHARVPSPLAPHALLERLSCQGPVLTALLHVLNALDWPRPALHASLIISSLGHHAI
jgi:hypothetical protein